MLTTVLTIGVLSATAGWASAAPGGAPIQVGVPRACVPVGGAFTATVDGSGSRIRSVTFTVDGRRAVVDGRAPFRAKVTTKGLDPQTLHELGARVTIARAHGHLARRMVKADFAVCPAA